MQGPKWSLFTLIWTICGLWMCWDKLCTKGRAPRKKETLPDFCERCWVTRHSRVFPQVDGLSTDSRGLGCHSLVSELR